MVANPSLEEKFHRAAGVVCKQGLFPFPLNDTSISIIKHVIGENEDELDLIFAFQQKASQTLDELTASSGFSNEEVRRITDSLAQKGLIFNQPSGSGIMVYRLLPLMNVGLLEYKFMGELTGDDAEKKLALLFEKLMTEVRDNLQRNYEQLLPRFKIAPSLDRTVASTVGEDGRTIRVVPVDKVVETPEEFILPSQSVEEIIDKFDDIAVGHCFCRQRRKVLGDGCATQAPTLNCFTFGKSARHTSSQGFARKVTKEEALKIMKEAEAAGLIHKAYHPASNESKPETSICNCCKDCCDAIRMWREGALPLINSTYYVSVIDAGLCTGCGTCVDLCPTDAITLNTENLAGRDADACLGCGVCARFCPEEAIFLKEGLRKVFIPPPKLCEVQPSGTFD
ncbi:MAG: 4Fe-4S dicluster domain-containing protein [Deltaproteobacteria bacterium]|nr:4Fe-4S dicluster domain-containing protein [Deltaproteobacteria bacterium]